MRFVLFVRRSTDKDDIHLHPAPIKNLFAASHVFLFLVRSVRGTTKKREKDMRIDKRQVAVEYSDANQHVEVLFIVLRLVLTIFR